MVSQPIVSDHLQILSHTPKDERFADFKNLKESFIIEKQLFATKDFKPCYRFFIVWTHLGVLVTDPGCVQPPGDDGWWAGAVRHAGHFVGLVGRQRGSGVGEADQQGQHCNIIIIIIRIYQH